ncbi:MAG TPA: lytic transglycosylase domain-containing protein [Solirubrobacteraceae bacterium]|jgi:soluble lytic murein transglycosylase-like protein
MSPQALAPTSSTAAITPGMLTANERVQRLQTLAAELRDGPASFAAALRAAGAGTGVGQASATGQPIATASQATIAGAGTTATGRAPYDNLIEAAATRNGVDPAVLHGLIQQESGFDPNSQSSAGAVGLTQLMPSTAASLGVSDPRNPAQSIEGGARYLAQMMQKFGGNVSDALAAYNAGPGAVQKYGGVPPYAETQQYVSKVLGYAAEYGQGAGGSTATPEIGA